MNKNKLLSMFEYNATHLKDIAEPGRMGRSKGIIAKYSSVTKGADGHARTIWDVPSEKGNKTYKVTLSVEPDGSNLFAMAKNKWNLRKFSLVLKSADVKIHCECRDFFFGGAKYNLGANGDLATTTFNDISSGHKGVGYRETNVVTVAPNKNDPERKNTSCKHCLSVISKLPMNTSRILKDCREYTGTDDDINETPLTNVSDDSRKRVAENFVDAKESLLKDTLSDEQSIEVVSDVMDRTSEPEDNETDITNMIPEPNKTDENINLGIDNDGIDNESTDSEDDILDDIFNQIEKDESDDEEKDINVEEIIR